VVEEGRERRFHTCGPGSIRSGAIIAKYRKIHPARPCRPDPAREFPASGKRYFEPGQSLLKTLGALVGVAGILICNDRAGP